jgi:RNA polymerase sigma factor (sigma-70 family)
VPAIPQNIDHCLRRIGRWRVPPNWSSQQWREEMGAVARAAAFRAELDFDPTRGVAFGIYLYWQVLGAALARYRQEWSYALRCSVWPEDGPNHAAEDRNVDAVLSREDLRRALGQLKDGDRWLIEQIYLRDRTESDVSSQLGITHQAVNKRKKAILRRLRDGFAEPAPASIQADGLHLTTPRRNVKSELATLRGSAGPARPRMSA